MGLACVGCSRAAPRCRRRCQSRWSRRADGESAARAVEADGVLWVVSEYEVEIDSHGMVTYEGREHVMTQGR